MFRLLLDPGTIGCAGTATKVRKSRTGYTTPMPRASSTLSPTLRPRAAGETTTRWLYQAMREQILKGSLRAGTQLPATRDLALQLGIARGTVVGAFEELKAEGYIEARTGSGTYVAHLQPDHLLESERAIRVGSKAAPAPVRSFSTLARRLQSFPHLHPGPARAFRTDQPALDRFPTELWARIVARRLRGTTASQLRGCGPLGARALQEAIAAYLVAARGVRCRPEQVAVVSGVQEALDLATRLFVEPGDRVALEEPGYIGARLVFEAAGAELVPVPVDEEGACLFPRSLAGVRLVYLTPAHQFPLGSPLSLSRRLAWLEWARSTGTLLFEDDYDSEYRYSGRPLPALQGLDEHGTVLFAGSFSKVLFPSLRLGYLVLPPDVIDRCAGLRSITQRHPPVLEQEVLAEFIDAGHFGRHVRRMRAIYAARLAVLLDEARRQLDGLLEISNVEAGLQTVGWLPEGVSASAAAEEAERHGVEISPLFNLPLRGERREGLHLGFAAVDEREIRRGVRALRRALSSKAVRLR